MYLRRTLRSIVYRFEDFPELGRALDLGDQELAAPPGVSVVEGEWVLATFDVGLHQTASAARGKRREGSPNVLAFETRDWDRLHAFAMNAAAIDAETPVTFRSAPGPGSDDEAVASDAAVTRKPGVLLRPSSSRARVLLVDDDPEIREVVGAMLEAVGLVVEVAESAEEALGLVRTREYGLLVLDWILPGMSGLELCRLVRQESAAERWGTLPVLFLTAHGSSKDVVDAFASGADDFVVKPFRAPELGARIFGLLRRSRLGLSV